MIGVGWWVAAVIVVALLTLWIAFTITRLDRLQHRVGAAQATLDAQLTRRANALLQVADAPDSGIPDDGRAEYRRAAEAALQITPVGPRRAERENAVGHAVGELAEAPGRLRADAEAELREAAVRVLIARRFYNDAVRDTRALRARRTARLFHLGRRHELPLFFDIDDTMPVAPAPPPVAATTDHPREENR